jgi:hypothetical protein
MVLKVFDAKQVPPYYVKHDLQGRDGCLGACSPDAPCWRHFETTAKHPGVYVIDTSTSKQPQQSQPQHLLRTITTYNAKSINLVSADPDGTSGSPTIEMLEKVHVCHLPLGSYHSMNIAQS